MDPILWTTNEALKGRGEASVSFGSKGTPLELFRLGDLCAARAGWAERSDPERSDGEWSGAQPALAALAMIPARHCCTSVPFGSD